MGQCPAEGSPVPDLWIRELFESLHEQQRVLVDQRVTEHVRVRGHRADHDRVAVITNPSQRVDPSEVDDHRRHVQPHPQHRQQALTAGEHLRVLTGFGERRQRLRECGRGNVVELCGDHCVPPSLLP